MASSYVILGFFAVFSALFSNVHCTAGCNNLAVTKSEFKITGDDLFGNPEDVQFELNDCVMTLSENLHIKEMNELTVKYNVKKGAFPVKEGVVDICNDLKNNNDSDNEIIHCLLGIFDTTECPISDKQRKGSCDISSQKGNMKYGKGKTEFTLEFYSDRGNATIKGFVDIQKPKKE